MMSRLLALLGTLTLCAALAAAGGWAATVVQRQPGLPDLDPSADVPPAQAIPTAPASPTRRARPDVFYAALVERPLFAPARRPVAPEAVPVADAPAPDPAPVPLPDAPPPPELGLLGVMGIGDDSRALVSNTGGDPVWVTEGTSIGGWTITAIGVDWLDLTLESETIRIEMYQQ